MVRYTIFFFTFVFHSIVFSFTQVLFTPRDDIRLHLIQLIKEERVCIYAAIYMFTDKSIAQALVDAYVRGVKIFLILDQISMGEKYGKGLFLQNSGISIVVHRVAALNPFCAPIMHHKFFVFGWNSRMHCSLVWSGSFNCTASASRLHDENVIITDDQSVIEEYKKCFMLLSDRLQQHG
jgi:phospholipase D